MSNLQYRKERKEKMERTAFMTINQAAKAIGLPHTCLRAMLANNSLPGFYSGSRYYVNMEMLKEDLEMESRTRSRGGASKSVCQK